MSRTMTTDGAALLDKLAELERRIAAIEQGGIKRLRVDSSDNDGYVDIGIIEGTNTAGLRVADTNGVLQIDETFLLYTPEGG